MAKMDESTLRSVLSAHIDNSLGFFGGRIAKERLDLMEYYNGEPFGNEIEGRSQVVSMDVAEVIESAMPSLMRVFSSGSQIVEFSPTKPGEEAGAAQATDYINWIWEKAGGFGIFYDWFKDALLQRLGVIKIWWEEQSSVDEQHYTGITDIQVMMLAQDEEADSFEIVEDLSYPDPTQPAIDGQPQAMLHDVVCKTTKKVGKICVSPVPPEEFLIERRAVSLDETPFVAHRRRWLVTDLYEQGYPRDLVEQIPTEGEAEYNVERIERFRQEDELPYRTTGEFDPTTREVWVTECYLRVDYDGDGYAEWRQITLGGEDNYVILSNEPIDDHPFAALTPIRMPHKLYGVCPADQAKDIQLIKSTILRQGLDNLYLANNKRMFVQGRVNMDDLLVSRPGGIVRGDTGSSVTPLEINNVLSDAMSMIEYQDSVRDKRTGITVPNQGLDADSINKTFGGLSLIKEQEDARVELIARNFAETGVKRAFKRILELVVKHQNKPQIIRKRGDWVNIDPREWTTGYDMSINVGLGTGARRERINIMMNLLNLDERLAQYQQGLDGPFVTPENIYNKLKQLVQASGFEDVEPYYQDPKNAPPKPQQPQQEPPQVMQERMRLVETQMKTEAQKYVAQVKAEAELAKEHMNNVHEQLLAHAKAYGLAQ